MHILGPNKDMNAVFLIEINCFCSVLQLFEFGNFGQLSLHYRVKYMCNQLLIQFLLNFVHV